MRRTKIICTIGPASEDEENLRKLILAGMNVARMNFSHGSHQIHKQRYDRIEKIRSELNLPVATLLDTKGPEIRLMTFEDGKVELLSGQTFTLTMEDIVGTNEKASITYKGLIHDVSVGTHILIDDGLIEMVVESLTDTDIICKVLNGGFVSNRKGINVPGVSLSMPYISETDRNDIIFGCDVGYDFLAASFVRSKEDILEVRKIIEENHGHMKIIAKIENMQGINNLEEILAVSDGIMVARGDLGVEIPLEEVPILQKKMIKMADAYGKYVITATQMLDSMMKNPRPTRAETTDVANAIYDGTTAIMLSGETAAGAYPIEAVQTMARIAERTEQSIDYRSRMIKREQKDQIEVTTAVTHATCDMAMKLNAAAIITVTLSGFTADMVSRHKPTCPIVAGCVSPSVCRKLNLAWGVTPLWINRECSEDDLFATAIQAAKSAGIVNTGDVVVLTAGVPLGVSGKTNTIRVATVE